ncbi:protein TolR [Viridibacterium curvum]|uniref:Protein TolR n=1 Tax=Viridibacterium curvum TaxID=1101404 RepID=A0ABP9QMC1_9RHOO
MRQRRFMNQINVVPYIDVMLVLLVIFMVTAPMMPTGTIDLPSVAKSTPPKPQSAPLQIDIASEKDWTLRDTAKPGAAAEKVGKEQLLARIKTAQGLNPDQAVVISASKSVRYETVMQVMDLLQRNQVAKVGLLVRQPEN